MNHQSFKTKTTPILIKEKDTTKRLEIQHTFTIDKKNRDNLLVINQQTTKTKLSLKETGRRQHPCNSKAKRRHN